MLIFLPGESHGRRSLVGYSPRGRKESDTTERLHYILPPMGDSTLGTTGGKKKGQNSYNSASHLFSAQLPPPCLIKPLRKQLIWFSLHIPGGFPGGTSSKEPACQCRRCRFDPWVGKIPWGRARQPTPAVLPRESHG